MNKDFGKLDAFMREHVHKKEVSAPVAPPLPRSRAHASLPQSLLALGIAGLVTMGIMEKKKATLEDALYLEETLTYDLAGDDMPELNLELQDL